MKWLTGWFIDNPVAANLLMVLILAGGVLSLGTLRVESFPQTPPSELQVTVSYPGGTAKQVDEGITQRIEDAISSVPGISRTSSASYRGHSSVTVRKTTDTDLDRLMEDIRTSISSIEGLPELAEKPQIHRNEFTNLAMFVMVGGDLDESVLQQSALRVEQHLKRHKDISQVANLGKRQAEIVIAPDPEKLKRYGLGVGELSERIRQWSFEYRSGELKAAQGALVLRADGHADNLLRLKQLPVINTPDGDVLLGAIADIRRGFKGNDAIVRYQGQPAIALMISTSRKDNLFRISESVATVLEEVKPTLPVGTTVDVMADMSPYIDEQLSLLSTNAWQGLLIVLVLLGLFLNVKLAFWVALGIPVSLSGALWLMGLPGLEYSINDITLFGMILVLGILVDDAVVVGESIHHARQRITDPRQAAREGVEAVSVATVFGVLTTIAAFSPMLWIKNELAQVLAGFSAVVILALVFSLIESKFILPSHLAFGAPSQPSKSWPLRWIGRAQSWCDSGLNYFTQHYYKPLLRRSLINRTTVLFLFISLMTVAWGLLDKGSIRSVFFPEIPGRYMTVLVTMDEDAPLPLAHTAAKQLEEGLSQTSRLLEKQYSLSTPLVNRYLVSIEGPTKVELTAELTTEGLKAVPAPELLNRLQEETGLIEGSYAVKYTAADDVAGGTAITIAARDRELARQVAAELKQSLSAQPGVRDVYDDGQGGQRQIQLNLNERGRQIGLNQHQLAILVGGAYGGLEVQRLLDKGEDTRLLIRFSDSRRKTREQLLETPVFVEPGKSVPLGEVADLVFTREPQKLLRRNRDEVVTVYWRQDRSVAAPEEVLKQLNNSVIADLEHRYIGVKINAVGEFEEIAEVQSGFKKALLLTLLLIYILLAVPLKSYWQPLIIMSVIPFGYAGAVYGHGIMGLPVSILSLFGMMAMTGVVINDSLVLMTRFNDLYHKEQMPVMEALIQAGCSRMRAIFLTTVTTVCGLLPLLSETSEQAQYLKPAAVSLVFGELFATPITLILIPVLLAFGKYRRGKESSDMAASPT